ncbi:hypothetical protein K402DRAFT_457697 [Aulographum hederae CBS 113979]|uniref:Heterokaryon incompatibility domain-containing protein n=1 Tax=Aulographum hederae CBS 113979 TaxID=1176131 RepID=A0A6G1GM73_9PEZI|nr:hypothetical protein K402DRAFT_457697 [Aulographum hederae CBS 113979]
MGSLPMHTPVFWRDDQPSKWLLLWFSLIAGATLIFYHFRVSKVQAPKVGVWLDWLDCIRFTFFHRKYRYEALPSDKHCIRLVSIGRGSGPLQVSLRTVVLDDATLDSEFDALSYTWGHAFDLDPTSWSRRFYGDDSHRLFPIWVNDGSYLLGTRNLVLALIELRRRGRRGEIWIDALCINQDDLAERAAQVAKMGRIYLTARDVSVWLGPETEDSSLAIQVVRDISAMQRSGIQEIKQLAPWNPILTSKYGFRTLDLEDVRSYVSLVSRSWFSRVWVIQETVLAANPIFICGRENISWRDLGGAVTFLKDGFWEETIIAIGLSGEKQRGEEHLPGLAISAMTMFRVIRAVDSEWRPTSILLGLRSLKAMDPRDKVYAAIGLVPESHSGVLLPEYQQPVSRVYTRAARSIIDCEGELSLLSLAGQRSLGKQIDLPSWVPDFSAGSTDPIACNSIAKYKGCERWMADKGRHMLRVTKSSLESSILKVAGVSFDEIVDIGEDSSAIGDHLGMEEIFAMTLRLNKTYFTGEDRTTVLWRTLMSNRSGEKSDWIPGSNVGDGFRDFVLLVNTFNIGPTSATEKNSRCPEPAVLARTRKLIACLHDADQSPYLSSKHDFDSARKIRNEDPWQISQAYEDCLNARKAGCHSFMPLYQPVYFGRRLIRTRKNYLGITAKSVRPGDQVFILAGPRLRLCCARAGMARLRWSGKHMFMGL